MDDKDIKIAQEIQANLLVKFGSRLELENQSNLASIGNLSDFHRLKVQNPNAFIIFIVAQGDNEAERIRANCQRLREEDVAIYPYTTPIELEQYIAMWDKHC